MSVRPSVLSHTATREPFNGYQLNFVVARFAASTYLVAQQQRTHLFLLTSQALTRWIQRPYFIWQLSLVTSRRYCAARTSSRMSALRQYDKTVYRKRQNKFVRYNNDPIWETHFWNTFLKHIFEHNFWEQLNTFYIKQPLTITLPLFKITTLSANLLCFVS